MPYTPNYAPGDVLTAAAMNSIGDAWTSYGSTASFTAATTSPTLGTGGTWTAYYSQINKVVRVRGRIVWGSTGRALGTGNYYIALPVTAKSDQPTVGQIVGQTFYLDFGGLVYPGQILFDTTSRCSLWYTGDTGLDVINMNQVSSTQYPHTVGNGDLIDFTFTYEAA